MASGGGCRERGGSGIGEGVFARGGDGEGK